MKKIILFSCLFISLAVHAQREKAQAYINTYKELAIAEMLRVGVPASITLAQGVLESQYGESDLAKTSNNHFGIKCKTEWTGAKTYHDDDEKGECFRVYESVEKSYMDHSEFLKSRPHYAFLFKLDPTDYDGWAKGLKKAGYATSPTYPQQLLKVINDYNLQQYSLQALARQNNDVPATNNTAMVSPPMSNTILPEIKNMAPVEKEIIEAMQPEKIQEAIIQPVVTTKTATKKPATYPQGIFSINHVKVIYGTEGTSFLSLAEQYDIPLGKLLEFNDLSEMDVLDVDRLIFIERKLKKGSNDFHTVSTGETLHDICQTEGIRLDSLLEYNNLKKGTILSSGEKVMLHAANTPVLKPVKSTR